MQKFILFCAIIYLLCACSEQACDPTGQRYMQMMKEGTPLTEKDKACVQANWLKESENFSKSLEGKGEIGTQKAINWSQTLFPKKQAAPEKK